MGVGNLHRHPILGWPIRGFILVGGLCLATPGGSNLIPFSDLQLATAALILAGSASLCAFLMERRYQRQLAV